MYLLAPPQELLVVHLSESQQSVITFHVSPWRATLWPPCQSQASKMWRWEDLWHRHTHIPTLDVSDLAPLCIVTTHTRTVYSAVLYWRVSGYAALNKSHEAVLLCLALFFPVCSASDRKIAKNHGLSQLYEYKINMKKRHDCICSDDAECVEQRHSSQVYVFTTIGRNEQDRKITCI